MESSVQVGGGGLTGQVSPLTEPAVSKMSRPSTTLACLFLEPLPSNELRQGTDSAHSPPTLCSPQGPRSLLLSWSVLGPSDVMSTSSQSSLQLPSTCRDIRICTVDPHWNIGILEMYVLWDDALGLVPFHQSTLCYRDRNWHFQYSL